MWRTCHKMWVYFFITLIQFTMFAHCPFWRLDIDSDGVFFEALTLVGVRLELSYYFFSDSILWVRLWFLIVSLSQTLVSNIILWVRFWFLIGFFHDDTPISQEFWWLIHFWGNFLVLVLWEVFGRQTLSSVKKEFFFDGGVWWL
jgi:hypothetical protein